MDDHTLKETNYWGRFVAGRYGMSDQQVPTIPARDPQPEIIARPPEIVTELPPNYRWEFTRRHPYYLLFWEVAHRHWQHPSDDPLERTLGETAVLVLRQINVTGDPLPPGTNSEDGASPAVARVWRDGAIAPLSFRALVAAMLHCLPPESRTAIGEFLLRSVTTEDGEAPPGYHLISEFVGFRDPALDMLVPGPIVSINLQAPQRAIVNAIEKMVRDLKDQQGITEHRRREDKLPGYLAVWDRREGWCGDHYDVTQEKGFREIAKDLSESMSTIANRYRSAFRFLTGHDFRAEIWARVMGLFKVTGLVAGDARRHLTARHRWISPERRERQDTFEVSESVISREATGDHRGTFLENMREVQDMTSASDLIMDIQDLIKMDYDDHRIAAALGMELEEVGDLIQYLRDRQDDAV